MAMQLALFSARPDVDAEIIYVLDDPRLWNEAERLAQSCWARFALPFTLVDLGAHLGYAPANNAGLAAVRAGHVCLLNADVFPRQGDGMAWLAVLCDPLHDMAIGAVGATLLFENDTVQHAGMSYHRIAGLPPWPFPVHTQKGRRLEDGASGTLEVAAVTGACLAVRRDDLKSLGGLDEDCIIADFEDACLCEALRARGLGIVLHQGVLLHHLERQTPGSDASWRFGATLVNASHFAMRWRLDAQT
jgi:GT2 family glycosyltransferase